MIEHGTDLLNRDTWKPLDKLGNQSTVLKVIE